MELLNDITITYKVHSQRHTRKTTPASKSNERHGENKKESPILLGDRNLASLPGRIRP